MKEACGNLYRCKGEGTGVALPWAWSLRKVDGGSGGGNTRLLNTRQATGSVTTPLLGPTPASMRATQHKITKNCPAWKLLQKQTI
ncbi:hypothetical protein E2C01_008564 [Portunus trituberculatus]|uniref:Uncharacterized protein n=1 Tax=Portunus trituberculatus TaxID=210409 RepID=A0A5B7D266_PORTR|nr:hypothetical protein [Portunus trituberculatus]